MVGLFAGVRIGPINAETLTDLISVSSGVVLVWAGRRGTHGQVLAWTRVLAVAFLLLGAGAAINRDLFGVFTYRFSAYDIIRYLLYGAVGIWAGWRPAVPA